MPKLIKRLYSKLLYLHNKKLRGDITRRNKKLKNPDPSIISINCVGGIMYHDLKLRFLSPTINMFFDQEEFLIFLENLEDFLKITPEEIFEPNITYPIGILRLADKSVRLYFMHYETFEQAKEKWVERSKRVNFNNLFIVWEYPTNDGPTKELAERFFNLKYENKVLITGKKCQLTGKNIVKLDIYNKSYFHGKLMANKTKKILFKKYTENKRYLDDFDYVKFLNDELKY